MFDYLEKNNIIFQFLLYNKITKEKRKQRAKVLYVSYAPYMCLVFYAF